MNTLGYQADLAYNIALCYFKQKQFGPALKHIAEIIEVGSIDIWMLYSAAKKLSSHVVFAFAATG